MPRRQPFPKIIVPASTFRLPTDEESIRHHTTREKVISVMTRIHREVIDPIKFREQMTTKDFMFLEEPNIQPAYDEGMEVELKMENCVEIDTLVKNVLTGKFVLCRTITPSSRLFGVDAGVEDVTGKKAVRLALFNYSMDAKMGKSDFEAVLPLGTMMIVRNPVFKKCHVDSVNFGVIAQNPADVELLSPKRMAALFPGVKWKSELPQESRRALKSPLVWEFTPGQSNVEIAVKLKNVGNRAFIQNRATDAIRFYNIALEYLPEEEITVSVLLSDILCNKAAALIKLGCFNPALLCTEKVLAIDGGHVKAIYRHAKGLIGLGRYAEAGQFLDEKLSQIPSLGQENEDLVKLRSIIPAMGKPPGKEIIVALLRPGPPDMHKPQPDLPVGMIDRISEYRGPVELGPSKIGEGEGLFATQDLPVGTVLLVCKPFAGLYVKSTKKKEFSLSTNPYKYLVGTMANKIWLDPLLGRDIYALWAGPELKSLTDKNDPKITKVDIARLTKICSFNVTNNNFTREDIDAFISAGVWISPSKINHSCVDANVMYPHHETSLVMMVTTFKEVKKGEELVSSYVPGMMPLSERDFMQSHGFICECRLCRLDRSESVTVIAKRANLLKSLTFDLAKYLKNMNVKVLEADLETFDNLEMLRAATPDLDFALPGPDIHQIVSIFVLPLGLYDACLHIMEAIYTVMENVPTNYVKHAFAETILVVYMKKGTEKAVLEKWVEEVRKYCRLYAGTLEHVRAGDHPTIPEDLKKFGIEFFNEETD
ncbi:uncharacterized protein LOC110850500 [Folsomia candida]|uniref:Small glutamine-rich tetratricopeptide repeat-containing protein alpha n=1 Tax=Folsomia candida TaxID=158441 RepID=A0A226EBQ0_FOLCA|nr:uncharacterized protein LOC110850500 [Folsomia candida]OXA54191.1 Small glutamine-rich tetratricopeptide repeat-containing protein alpha [Folsomia candida]